MSKTKIIFNKEWHAMNIMPVQPTLEQQLNWHIEHRMNCACRPIPEKLMVQLKKLKLKG